MFPNTIKTLRKKSPLPLSDSLNVFLDKDELLRVGGRLSQSMKDYESCHPLILHGNHHLSTLTIQSEHKQLCHAGPKLTLGSLQNIYYINNARRVVHEWIRECMVCKQASPKITTQLMGQLPSTRVLPTFANDKVSVDYAGPFTLKVGSTRKPTYCKSIRSHFRLPCNRSLSYRVGFRPLCRSLPCDTSSLCFWKRKTYTDLE